MPHEDYEVLAFRACRDLEGTIQRIDAGRRNGKPVVFFVPDLFRPGERSKEPYDFRDDERFFVNLNPVERSTWRRILSAQSIAAIAKEDRVTRSAVYARVEGNRKGQGGMIAKNFWVLLWWRLRQKALSR